MADGWPGRSGAMGMDLDRLAGVEPAVDEAAVEEELRRYLAGERDDEVGREPWVITTVGQADWAIRMVADADRRTAAYQDEIDLWTAAKKRLGAAAEWCRERLEEWAIASRTDRVKSFPLAHGTVATKKVNRAIDVVDEDAAIAWAKKHVPGAVKVEESLLKSALGDAARIVEVIVAYEAINQQTGDVERVPLAAPEPVDEAKLAKVRERLGDGYTVNPLLELAVHDQEGRPVPGLAVRAERVSATVTPLWK